MKAKKALCALAVGILGIMPLSGLAQGFKWEMSPKYIGEIHAGYKTTVTVNGMNTYSAMAELGTLQGVSLNQYLDVALGVDALMLTHYYKNCGLRFAMSTYIDIRPAYPITDKFKVFLDLGLGAWFGIHAKPELGHDFFCQFGPGIRYKKFNLSLGLQNFGENTTAFYTKVGLYF